MNLPSVALARRAMLLAAGGILVAVPVVVPSQASAANGRGYEMVSPMEKGGQAVFLAPTTAIGITRASQDGNALVYSSWGSFAGSTTGLPMSYMARRTETSWVNSPVSPAPVNPYHDATPPYDTKSMWADASRNLETGYLITRDYFDPTDVNNEYDAYRRESDGRLTLVSRGNGAERIPNGIAPDADRGMPAVSADGSHILFATDAHLVPEDADRAVGSDLYLHTGGRTYLVNQADGGGLLNRCGSQGGVRRTRRMLSDDGSRVIFETPQESNVGDPDCSAPRQVYMRVDSERTIHISASRRTVPEPAGNAVFEGASGDGRTVYISTPEALNDADVGGGVYRYTATDDRLEKILRATSIFVKTSSDGSHVYFYSNLALTPDAVLGNYNLYVDTGEDVQLLGSDPTGAIATDLTPIEPQRPVIATPDGRHLVFSTTAPLTAFDPGGFRQVYLYSVEDQRLTCVSCDPAGQRIATSAPRSNASFGRTTDEDSTSSITADGRTLVFQTGDQLVARDVNERRDIYEYRDGRVHLVTSGRGREDAQLIGMSSGGRDIFFATNEGLVPSDNDNNMDVYDARVGGGFPEPPRVIDRPCIGDVCQGPPTAPPASDALGSEHLSGDGQSTESEVERTPKSVSVASIGRRAKARFARTGVLGVRVTIAGGGTAQARVTGVVGGRSRSLASAKRTVRSDDARTVRLVLRLNRAGRRQLARTGRLRVRLTVTLSGSSRRASTNMLLTRNRT